MAENTKSLCVFDFDGTLVDSMSTFATIAATVIEEFYSIPPQRGYELYLKTSGVPFFEQLEILFPGDFRNQEASEKFEQEKKKIYLDQPLCAGTEELLQTLHKKGIKIAISSNNYQKLVSEFVEAKGLPCDFVLGYQPKFSKGKEHFEYLKKTLSLNNQQILFVGDSLKDGEKAQGCSIDFVAKLGTFNEEDFDTHFPNSPVIDNLKELINII